MEDLIREFTEWFKSLKTEEFAKVVPDTCNPLELQIVVDHSLLREKMVNYFGNKVLQRDNEIDNLKMELESSLKDQKFLRERLAELEIKNSQ